MDNPTEEGNSIELKTLNEEIGGFQHAHASETVATAVNDADTANNTETEEDIVIATHNELPQTVTTSSPVLLSSHSKVKKKQEVSQKIQNGSA